LPSIPIGSAERRRPESQGKELDMKTLLNRFVRDESGATAIEYGLIAALIAVAIIVVLGTIGTQLNITFDRVADALTAANAAP
jgi:pilus assembly protein Flp/PilA